MVSIDVSYLLMDSMVTIVEPICGGAREDSEDQRAYD